ncbi:EGF-like repeat and discoidin I-like domain-containing protein 3 [Dendronephthya gigantea]|uniref:EGF-like repeat and discoidin I-like domain-containing protein 3 n=1 Tax=Dendronephthya gigantea TaxID=151771 RepID=UPI00106B7AE2|nr:EGF-like repeat and discoidin I-like domain-containing protein 3 [Dendronephthya gigantea]
MIYRMSAATINVLTTFFPICLLGITQALPEKCHRALGLEDGRIRDSQITCSSVRKGTNASSEQARLRHNISPWGAWCPDTSRVNVSSKNNSYDQFIEIDLLYPINISGVAIQGREYNGGREFVESYKISYSINGSGWIYYAYSDKKMPFDMVWQHGNLSWKVSFSSHHI